MVGNGSHTLSAVVAVADKVTSLSKLKRLQDEVKLLCKQIDYINKFELSCFEGDNKIFLSNVHIDDDYMKSADYEVGDYIGWGFLPNGKRKYFRETDIIKLYKQ